ncbi:MAG: N-acetyl-gamma-glutamyl-phosphate reductase [Cardiobacteriaceae bacterium]|nr:N-acetyl-gamma-glutamyl-phosphate reductase [Cardiobacteriaceae bacterium]
MNRHRVFIDGSAGTTGLRIYERLNADPNIELLTLNEKRRKDIHARLDKITEADLTILCLPDDAAKEIAHMAPAEANLCDTSTAHRVSTHWTYGFPELHGQRERIKNSLRVSIPGCHATGFLSLIRPLIETGVVSKDIILSCHSITGYSGGGNKMIDEYQTHKTLPKYTAPRLYGLTMQHKHLAEMQKIADLLRPPIFCPIVSNYRNGILFSMPLLTEVLPEQYHSPQSIASLFIDYYQNSDIVHIYKDLPSDGMLEANALAGKDSLHIFISGNNSQLLLCANFDNLGKGASGAAIQCMNLMLGRNEIEGLVL